MLTVYRIVQLGEGRFCVEREVPTYLWFTRWRPFILEFSTADAAKQWIEFRETRKRDTTYPHVVATGYVANDGKFYGLRDGD